ncbi:hypothetical protein YC2023_079604 [Brassica napus]
MDLFRLPLFLLLYKPLRIYLLLFNPENSSEKVQTMTMKPTSNEFLSVKADGSLDESPVRFINAATSRGSSKSSLQLRQTRDSPICRPFVVDPPLKCVSSDSGILECEEIQ